jgi:hypothetical protein
VSFNPQKVLDPAEYERLSKIATTVEVPPEVMVRTRLNKL